jgi:hypothetical protein
MPSKNGNLFIRPFLWATILTTLPSLEALRGGEVKAIFGGVTGQPAPSL